MTEQNLTQDQLDGSCWLLFSNTRGCGGGEDSPPSSNCSRKYTDDSARTAAADAANSSRRTAAMARGEYRAKVSRASAARRGRGFLPCAPRCCEVTVDKTPRRRRRGSPLGSEQMSESDWLAAASVSGASVTALANQRTEKAISGVASLRSQQEETTRWA